MTTIANELLPSESQTASYPAPPSLATCVSSWSPVQLESTEDLRTWLQAASPANLSALPENEQAPTMPATCGPQLSQPFAQYDRDSRSWRMCQGWLLAAISAPSWETWPKAGTTHDGAFYPQPKWERRISAIGSGLLPTPAAQEPGWVVGGTVEVVDKDGNPPTHANQRFYDKNTGRIVQKGLTQVTEMFPTPIVPNGGRHHNLDNITLNQGTLYRRGGSKAQMDLQTYVRLWPTPTKTNASYTSQASKDKYKSGMTLEEAVKWATPQARDYRTGHESRKNRPQQNLNDQVGGKLNPTWVEWLMGWPLGWTDCAPLGMDKFQQWLKQHGIY